MKIQNIENLQTLAKLQDASPKAIEVLLELLENSTPRIKLAAATTILKFAATQKPKIIYPSDTPEVLEAQLSLIENWSKNDETSPSIQPEYKSEFHAKLASET
jgi:predicted RecB family nuclease